MDVREKLVELLKEIVAIQECGFGDPRPTYETVASYLMSHGVTVQEWIPVEDPPKEYRDEYGELIPFLVCEEGTDYPFMAMYDGKTWGDGVFACTVKWWMQLPQPPKEGAEG